MGDLEHLAGSDFESILQIVHEAGGTAVHAQKLLTWLYRRREFNFDALNDIPKSVIGNIRRNHDAGIYNPIEKVESADGSAKFLFRNGQGQLFESVLMQSPKRKTLCVSTQSGCRMGCKFCLTGCVDFKGNLHTRDVISQLLSVPNSKSVNRIVFMGMGEPLDNFDTVTKSIQILTADWGCAFGKANITLSTVGILTELEVFLKNPACNLAVSLHTPFPDERKMLMPVEQSNPIREVVRLIRKFPIRKPLRLSFEYVALGGLNLGKEHALAVAELLKGLPCHVNIIPWNYQGNNQFRIPELNELQNFIQWLNAAGIYTTTRISKAAEINAACGQLARQRI